MDRLEAMSLFVAIADSGSLTQAARRRRVPLATLSRKLRQLEEHIGARLVTRTTRRLVLSDAGRVYLDTCRRVIGEIAEAEAIAGGERAEPAGTLHITAPIVFGRLHMLPAVTAFLEVHKAVDVRLLLLDRLVEMIEERQDVALRIGDLDDSSLIAVRVGAIRRITCASPAYVERRGRPREPADLDRHAIVAFDQGAAAERWTFAGSSVAVRPRLAVNTAESAIDAAIGGLGITRVLSYQAANAIASGALVEVLERHAPPEMQVSLVHLAGRFVPARVRAFIDFAAPMLRRALTTPRSPPRPATRRDRRAATR